MTRAVFPRHRLRFVGDAGLDDQQIFAWIAAVDGELVIRASHLERRVEVAMDRDGPYLVLRGLAALWQTVATLTFLVVEPFPRQLFVPLNRCG